MDSSLEDLCECFGRAQADSDTLSLEMTTRAACIECTEEVLKVGLADTLAIVYYLCQQVVLL